LCAARRISAPLRRRGRWSRRRPYPCQWLKLHQTWCLFPRARTRRQTPRARATVRRPEPLHGRASILFSSGPTRRLCPSLAPFKRTRRRQPSRRLRPLPPASLRALRSAAAHRHRARSPPSLPYKADTCRPSLRTNWTRLVPFPHRRSHPATCARARARAQPAGPPARRWAPRLGLRRNRHPASFHKLTINEDKVVHPVGGRALRHPRLSARGAARAHVGRPARRPGRAPAGRPPPPPFRTKWTRRVPHPVLIGHAASLTPH
jgi:hypothetical protein